jgi:SAM-dependent methyltransferase
MSARQNDPTALTSKDQAAAVGTRQRRSTLPLRVLVAIASFGTRNEKYLNAVIAEYLSMPYEIDILVLSNVPRTLAAGAEVIVVDLTDKDPWSLPFPHKQIFAERMHDYDLFIYSEDDTLISRRNIEAFLDACESLGENEIAGFFRFERGSDGRVNYPEAHGRFHWDCQSVRRRGGHLFASFTNDHSACYALTRAQLRRAIDSGGFLVPPHSGKYDLLCSAATDPYTQCGFEKVIGISNFDDFLVHHLPNKYVGSRFGVGEFEFRSQIEALVRIAQNGSSPRPLFPGESKLIDRRYSRDYYQPVDAQVISMIPKSAQTILSIGCGSGATEAALAERGLRVVALPMDPVIASGAKSKGVEVVETPVALAREALASDQFDCVFSLDLLHLVDDPGDLLATFARLLRRGGTAIVRVPRISRLRALLLRIRGDQHAQSLGTYENTGVHITSPRVLKGWFEKAGLKLNHTVGVSGASSRLPGPFRRLVDPVSGGEILAVAVRV